MIILINSEKEGYRVNSSVELTQRGADAYRVNPLTPLSNFGEGYPCFSYVFPDETTYKSVLQRGDK